MHYQQNFIAHVNYGLREIVALNHSHAAKIESNNIRRNESKEVIYKGSQFRSRYHCKVTFIDFQALRNIRKERLYRPPS